MYDSAQNEIDFIAMKSGAKTVSRFQATEEKKTAMAAQIQKFEDSVSAALAAAQAEWDEE